MLNEYKKILDVLISLHNTDPELNHKIGKDPDYAYCDDVYASLKVHH